MHIDAIFVPDLWALFGDTHPEQGTFNAAGGAADPDNSLPGTPTPPIGQSSAGTSGKRASREFEASSPQKAKHPRSALDYMAEVSNSIAKRSSRPSVAEEMAEVMDILNEDGIEQGSELFLMACDLFQGAGHREQFKRIKERKDRITYITWTWHNGRNTGAK